MRKVLTIILCIFLLSCGRINTSPEFFKPDDKCYVVVEASLSLNEKFRELLQEALNEKKNEIEDSNLEYGENSNVIIDRPEKSTYSLGTFTYNNGDKYEGEWKDWVHHGQGTYAWLEGDSYEGEWKNGKFHGQGILSCHDERGDKFKYKGSFAKGKYHGHGKFIDPIGNNYVGQWEEGVKNVCPLTIL